MKIQIALFVCLFSVSLAASAQELKGTVYDGGSNAKMANVFVRDLNNNQVTMTDNNGNFSVKAAPGHLVVFTSPAYLSDTIYVVDFVPKTIRLASEGVSLQEVNITGKRLSFDPRRDYRQVYEKAKIRHSINDASC